MELFTREEIRDIIISVVAATIVFSYVIVGPTNILTTLPAFLFIVIISFLFHELAHKFVARKFGATAFFKMWPTGILLGLIFMFARIIILMPGAVVVYPYRFARWRGKHINLTVDEIGLISVSGPLVNMFFAAFFSFFSGWAFTLLTYINAILAFFNLLPIPPLDGSKVFMWKSWVWVMLIIISGFMIFPYLSAYFG